MGPFDSIEPIHGDTAIAELSVMAANLRVVAVGEEHYSERAPEFVLQLAQGMVANGGLDLLAVELPYSATAWLDAYVTDPSDETADAMLMGLEKYGLLDSDLRLLGGIRETNRARDWADVVHVAGFDIEHDGRALRTLALYPRFEDPANGATQLLDLSRAFVEPGRSVDSAQFAWNAPYTSKFIDHVLQNYQDTLVSYGEGLAEGKDSPSRRRAILRNLTHPDWLGGLWADGRVLVYGGQAHTGTRHCHSIRSELCAMAGMDEYAGQVFSIELDWYFVNLTSWSGVDYEDCRRRLADSSLYWVWLDRWMRIYKGSDLPYSQNICIGDCDKRRKSFSPNSERWTWLSGLRRVPGSTHDAVVVIPSSPVGTPNCTEPDDSPKNAKDASASADPAASYDVTIIVGWRGDDVQRTFRLAVGDSATFELETMGNDVGIRGTLSVADAGSDRELRANMESWSEGLLKVVTPTIVAPKIGSVTFYHQWVDDTHVLEIFVVAI